MEATWRWILVTAIAPIAWGSNYFVTRQLLPVDSPLWGAVLRALPAGLLLVALARELPRGSWWWRSAVLGVLNVGAFFVLIYVVSQLLPTSLAATLMATSAGVLMLIAWPLLGERPQLVPVIGMLVGSAGVVLMLTAGAGAGGGDRGTPGGEVSGLGVLASLGAMLLSSIGFVLTKKWSAGVRTLSLTSWQLVGGGLAVVPAAIVVEGPPPALDAPAIAGFAYVSLVATALAFVAWFTGLKHLRAGTVGVIGLLNPVTGVVLGTVIAGEAFGPAEAVGTALVLLGVLAGRVRVRPGRMPGRMRASAARASAGRASAGSDRVARTPGRGET
ncbi:DMT family transporter [Herbiconiux sp. A18JL235]|uniref:DMT family transporter n=1 Tax=Herbiconiux sp. A18JL235 TaxID=3152363 RepID=A0AB39BIT0_9MICO